MTFVIYIWDIFKGRSFYSDSICLYELILLKINNIIFMNFIMSMCICDKNQMWKSVHWNYIEIKRKLLVINLSSFVRRKILHLSCNFSLSTFVNQGWNSLFRRSNSSKSNTIIFYSSSCISLVYLRRNKTPPSKLKFLTSLAWW